MSSAELTYPNHTFKFCPRCGAKAFVAGKDFLQGTDSSNDMNCEQCQFRFFFNNSACVAAIITNEINEVMLCRRANDPAKGRYDFPGGFVNVGESAEEALKREIKEELNLEVVSWDYLGSFPNQYPFGGITYFPLDLLFACKVANLNDLKCADDVSAAEFVNPRKVNSTMLAFPVMQKHIDCFLNNYRSDD